MDDASTGPASTDDVSLLGHLASTRFNLWAQIWRPRNRKYLSLAFVAFFLALFLLLRELQIDISTVSWKSRELSPPIAHVPVSTTTVTAPAVAETATVYQNVPVVVKPDPVVFILIMWSEPSAIEGAILIKSILLYNTSPSEFHIICDDAAQKYLEIRLSLVTRPSNDVRVRFYKPSWQSMVDRVEREGSITTDHAAGTPGLMKLFMHEILPPTVKKGIFVDTDAFFIADPTLLWKVFDRLKPSTAIVMASHPDQYAPEWHHASRICSCIMLLDLEKLRDLRLMDSSIYREDQSGEYPPALSPPTFSAMYGPPGKDGHYEDIRLGDQGYWWAIVDNRPDIFEPLNYDFEVTSCLLDNYMTGLGNDTITESEEMSRQTHTKGTPQEGIVVLPKLLHFNCLHGTPIYMEWNGWSDPTNSLTIRWGAAVAYHVGLKWIWLNKGGKTATQAKLDISTIPNVVFADEQFAKARKVS